jgi:septal ring factor EnvC (AmiA/AmiB activator)
MTADYEGVEVRNFKESFNDGLAFSALINAMDPEALDFYALDQSEKEKNLNNAFDIAEQKLGIPKLLDPEDLLSGNADERAVILYSSMFFHAFIADEEKRKLVEQKKSIGEQIKELKEALEREKAEKERLMQERDQQASKSQRDFSDKDALIARLRARSNTNCV